MIILKKISEAKLTEGKISTQLIKLTLPMIAGMLGMVVFNLTDTYFVGQLGTDQLAALSFTFPVVLIINSFTKGIGIGATSIISKYIGGKEHQKVKRTASALLADKFILNSRLPWLSVCPTTYNFKSWFWLRKSAIFVSASFDSNFNSAEK